MLDVTLMEITATPILDADHSEARISDALDMCLFEGPKKSYAIPCRNQIVRPKGITATRKSERCRCGLHAPEPGLGAMLQKHMLLSSTQGTGYFSKLVVRGRRQIEFTDWHLPEPLLANPYSFRTVNESLP